ncbi:hypothetical protein M8J76_007368 [Diaphorina citri]|nr:hypothetical protein M8J76_007368 [Diaphorina citri]
MLIQLKFWILSSIRAHFPNTDSKDRDQTFHRPQLLDIPPEAFPRIGSIKSGVDPVAQSRSPLTPHRNWTIMSATEVTRFEPDFQEAST